MVNYRGSRPRLRGAHNDTKRNARRPHYARIGACGIESLESRQLLANVAFGLQQVVDDLDADGAARVVTADVDGDGDLDAVVGSYRDHQVAWYANQGDGLFQKRPIALDATEVRDLIVRDLDGDGDVDVAVAAYGADSIRWYENIDGRGTFDRSITLTTEGRGVRALGADDLDGDGDVDLVAGSWFDNQVSWFENQGQGRFSPPKLLGTSTAGPRSLQIGDVNGDLRPDIMVAGRRDDIIVWFPNQGGGNFGPLQTVNFVGNGPESIELGDADGDHDLDLFVSLHFDQSVVWLENLDGLGNFGAQQTVASTPGRGQDVALADLDGDGDLDVLAASYYDTEQEVAWYPNSDGLGSFGSKHLISTDVTGISHVVVADLDGDGWPDVATASQIDNKVSWFRNRDGLGNFDRPRQVLSDAGGAADSKLVDLDNDGDLDILTASYWDNKIAWYENIDSRGQYSTQKVISNIAGRAQSIHAADLDGDGDQDVLSASYGDGKISWYENLGQGVFGEQVVVTNRLRNPVHVHTADLDGDGDQDVISASAGDGIVAWYENTNGQADFGPIRVLSRFAIGVEWTSTADIDGDGDLDILNAAYGDGQLSWFENLGQASFSARMTIATVDGPTTLEAVDLDHDGDLDLVATTYTFATPSDLIWLENLGSNTFADPTTIATGITEPEALTIVDVDGNGWNDIVVGAEGLVIWFERHADGRFEMHEVTRDVADVFAVAAGDVNQDGQTDLVTASFFDSRILLFLNRSAPGDFDGDGTIDAADIDLLCAAFRLPNPDAVFDLTADGEVDAQDMDRLVEGILGTTYGDANVDGVFNSQDLVLSFQAGEYEDEEAQNSTWSDGDWNCDGEFGSDDLVLAFQKGGYTSGSHSVSLRAASRLLPTPARTIESRERGLISAAVSDNPSMIRVLGHDPASSLTSKFGRGRSRPFVP